MKNTFAKPIKIEITICTQTRYKSIKFLFSNLLENAAITAYILKNGKIKKLIYVLCNFNEVLNAIKMWNRLYECVTKVLRFFVVISTELER